MKLNYTELNNKAFFYTKLILISKIITYSL